MSRPSPGLAVRRLPLGAVIFVRLLLPCLDEGLDQRTAPEQIDDFRGVKVSPDIPDVYTAFRERFGRQAYRAVITLRLSVAQNPST
jgi:hypothetical protein